MCSCAKYVQLCWVLSHVDVHGNEQADLLAEMGQNLHPNNLLPLSKRRRVTEWDKLGLEPIETLSKGFCSRNSTVMVFPRMSVTGQGTGRVWDMYYSTDVSDNRRQKGRRVIKNASDVALRRLKPNLGWRLMASWRLARLMNTFSWCLTAPC